MLTSDVPDLNQLFIFIYNLCAGNIKNTQTNKNYVE